MNKIEWVIIDDSDTISSIPHEMVSSPVKLLHIPIPGRMPLGEKRNLANRVATGEIIVIMDDDDFYPSTRVKHAVDELTANPYYRIAGCPSPPILDVYDERLICLKLTATENIPASTLAYRREVLDVTAFNSLANYAEEVSFVRNANCPVLRLNPALTIIVMSHSVNTVSKQAFEKYNHKYIESISNLTPNLKGLCSIYRELSTKVAQLNNFSINSLNSQHYTCNPWKEIGIKSVECISLVSSGLRRKQIKSHMLHHDLDLNFFNAISPVELRDFFDKPCDLKKTQICCTLSHLFLLNMLAKKNNVSEDQIYLITEDDVELKQSFDPNELLNYLPFNWDIIQLGTNNPFVLDILLSERCRSAYLIPTMPNSWGTFGYLVNKKSANKIVSKFLANSFSVNLNYIPYGNNLLADDLLFSNFNSYTLCYPLARSCHYLGSSIGYSKKIQQQTVMASEKIAELWYDSIKV